HFQVVLGTKSVANLEDLRRDAITEFVRAYAAIGQPEKALVVFQRVDAKAAVDSLQVLAEMYIAAGSIDKAIAGYRQLAREPNRACRAQYDVAHAMLWMPSATNADKIAEIESLARLARTIAAGDPEADDCPDNALAMTGELARAFHNEATKTRNPTTAELAER